MKSSFSELPDGYRESIEKGINAVQRFGGKMTAGTGSRNEQMQRLMRELQSSERILIGAGAGLSAAAGFTYSGERFERYFFDFAKKYGIRDIYSGGFYPFPDAGTRWAWWARHIYYNRYIDPPKPVYEDLLALVKDKDHFVITTNVDHQFQRAGFDKTRLFYTQGDYGLFQSTDPQNKKTYDNEEWVMEAMAAQGFVKDDNGVFQVPEGGDIAMRIPAELIPHCPDDGCEVTMNLRSDDTFAEDEGWHRASAAYSEFLKRTGEGRVLFLELGVGVNTPVIIKYPFWQMVWENETSVYACVNFGEAFCPEGIAERSICIDGDIYEVLKYLLEGRQESLH